MRNGRLKKEEIKSLRKGLEEVRKRQDGKKTKNRGMIRVYILIAIIVAVLAVSGYLSITAKVISVTQTDKFAKCLSSSGLVLFGSEDCQYCDNLKSSLNSSASYLNYVDCSAEKAKCADIKEYPTWGYGGQNLLGEFSLQELSIITKCVL
ncbi:MAG TPA: hypothetical protein VJA47_00235 [archaeon]|nr:hypothetical protein [archaeon]